MEKIRVLFRKFLLKWLLKEEYNNLTVLVDSFKHTESRIKQKEKDLDQKLNEVHQRSKKLDILFENLDISVDHHMAHKYSNSWAVISLQGQKMDYIKFIDLGDSNIREISNFIRRFERNSNIKIDSHLGTDQLFGIERGEGKNGRNIVW